MGGDLEKNGDFQGRQMSLPLYFPIVSFRGEKEFIGIIHTNVTVFANRFQEDSVYGLIDLAFGICVQHVIHTSP